MTDALSSVIAKHRPAVEAALEGHLPLSAQVGAERLNEALRYAVFPGGKRWRPIFTLLGALLVGADDRRVLPTACAIEFLHTSSLILDDLPAIDDADLRRGRPALHVAFGERIALMAALALLNQAYALMAWSGHEGPDTSAASRLVSEAARCIGSNGMIGGQVVDMMNGHPTGAASLASRNLKTTALAKLTLTSGAIAVGADEEDIAALAHFGECFGTAYQAQDDLLDAIGEPATLGKPVRQDARHLRPTFVAQRGVTGSLRLTARLLEQGASTLAERFGNRREVRLIVEAADLLLGGTRRTRRSSGLYRPLARVVSSPNEGHSAP